MSSDDQEATWLGPTIFTVTLIVLFFIFKWMVGGGS
jgi:hypothetical protein